MADSKITALTALTAADPVNDMFPVVDVSDTTMAASGTTKKISVNNILGASGTATLASATITGDLTVDTNVLKVDTTNNRVGVNNASPSEALDVTGNGFFRGDISVFSSTGGAVVSKSLIFGSAANVSAASIYSLTNSATAGQLFLATETGGVMTDRLQISDTGVFSFLNVGGVAGTAMTLNSTGLLVGTSSTSGSSSNATSVVLGSARSANGTVSATTAVATTIFSITAALRGRYEVLAMIPSSGSADLYTSIATVIWDGSTGRVVANNGTNLTITLSGSDVQITQIAGSTQTVYWSFFRISIV